MSSPPDRAARALRTRTLLQLFGASAIVLFQELTFIRWLPVQVRVLAYFPNVVLISAFLGLGIGCLRSGRRSLLAFWPFLVALTVATAVALRHVAFTNESATEHLWLLYFDLPHNATVVPSVRLPIVLFFLLSGAAFIPLGQYVAERFASLSHEGAALWGYVADLSGSLAGVIAFAFFSFAGTWPVTWFTVFLAAGLLLDFRLPPLIRHAVVSAAVIFMVVSAENATFYSPYYALTVRQSRTGVLEILTNGSLHQIAAPLKLSDPSAGFHDVPKMQRSYHIPYRLLGRPPRNVLILGAGTGNDIAVALDEGAQHIDAVEIDPVILRIGRHHPDHPYADARVHAINADAREFLNNSSGMYDLVVFGTLDSQTRLSALSSVRLDNYVYTADCMRAVRRHLTADAGVVLYFGTRSFITNHIAGMIAAGLGERPAVLNGDFAMFTTIFMAGPAFRHLTRMPPLTEEQMKAVSRDVDIPTDDWPYLYLERRGISVFYVSLIALLATIAVVSVAASSAEMRRSFRSASFDPEMFLFGMAFLLVETRLVTEMSLVWGATWLTSSVVFGSILAMILAATILVQKKPLPWKVAAAGLVVSLLLTWAVPARSMIGLTPAVRLIASALFIGLPVFFASCCFALLFRDRAHADVAFGWNMLGAVIGGLLEFSSMAIGIKATTLLALAAYLVAIAVHERKAAAESAQAARLATDGSCAV